MTQKHRVSVLLGDPSLPYTYGPAGRIDLEELQAVEDLKTACAGLEDRYTFEFLNNHSAMFEHLRESPPDLALNFCDNGFRNRLEHELHVPAVLELLEIPYTGASPFCMSVCTDKAMVRSMAASQGIAVPNETLVDLRADPKVLPELYPALIKPNSADGSVGIRPDCVVYDPEQAAAYMDRLAGELQRPQALVQDFLTGDEYTVGVVGNAEAGFTVFPPLVVDYSRLDPDLPPILDYGSKVDPESPYWNALEFRPADLDEPTRAMMITAATTLFSRLDCRDYGRFDFRAGADGVPRMLDANYNPTWFRDGKLAMMAGYAGHDYTDLIGMILDAARSRYGL